MAETKPVAWHSTDIWPTLTRGEFNKLDREHKPAPVRGTTDYETSTGHRGFRWWDLAACRGAADPTRGGDPNLFYPDQHQTAARLTELRDRYCRECPVRVHCLEDALNMRSDRDWGIVAGFSERARRLMRADYRAGETVGELIADAERPPGRLNEDAVRTIRSSDEPVHVLAKRFGVRKSAVREVLDGHTWADVA